MSGRGHRNAEGKECVEKTDPAKTLNSKHGISANHLSFINDNS